MYRMSASISMISCSARNFFFLSEHQLKAFAYKNKTPLYSLLESFCTLEGVAIWGFSLKLQPPIHHSPASFICPPSNPLLMFPIFLHRIHFGQFFSTQNVQYLLLKSFANVCQTSNPSAPSSNWNWSLKLCLTRFGSAACAKLNLPPCTVQSFKYPLLDRLFCFMEHSYSGWIVWVFFLYIYISYGTVHRLKHWTSSQASELR